MRVYEYSDYKAYVRDRLKAMPKSGHGQLRKIAAHLGVNSVQMSHVFKGDRDLTPEQALEVSMYFGLQELEVEYFILLVQKERAGTHQLKKLYNKQIKDLQEEGLQLKHRLSERTELEEEAKAIFYSNWYYSAASLLSMIPGCDDVDAISKKLNLSTARTQHIVNFLVNHGLCEEVGGKLSFGEISSHLERESELASRHHSNWRLKGIENMEGHDFESEMYFTAPMTLSKSTMKKVRKELEQSIEKIMKDIKDSPSEEMACLNIDWFKV